MVSPTKSRFFSSGSESDSDTDSDSRVKSTAQKTTDFYKEFRDFVDDPPLSLKLKKSDTLEKRFRDHIIDTNDMPSPTHLMHGYIKQSSFGNLFCSSKGRQVVEEYVDRIGKAPDSPNRKLRSKYLQDAHDVCSAHLSSAPIGTAQYHKDGIANLDPMQRTLSGLKMIHCENYDGSPPSFLPIINLVHITKGEIQGTNSLGYHYYVQGAINVNISARNPVTRVFCGTFKLRENCTEKFSTFFPSSVNSEDVLVNVIQTAEKIAQHDNRFLYRTRTDVPFYMEKLFQKDGCVVQSAYPVFYFGELERGQTYQITETANLTSTDILKELGDLSHAINYQRYTIGDDIIVDIAPIFQDKTRVASGIYFRFPKDLLQTK